MGFFSNFINDIKKGGIGKAIDLVDKYGKGILDVGNVIKKGIETASTYPGKIGEVAKKLKKVGDVVDAATTAHGQVTHTGRAIDQYIRDLAGDGNVVGSTKTEGHAAGPPPMKRSRAGIQRAGEGQQPLRDMGSRYPGTMSSHNLTQRFEGRGGGINPTPISPPTPNPLVVGLKNFLEKQRLKEAPQAPPISTQSDGRLRNPFGNTTSYGEKSKPIGINRGEGRGGLQFESTGGGISQGALEAIKGL